MSYEFNAVTERALGLLTTPIDISATGLSIAMHVYRVDWDTLTNYLFMLSATQLENDDSVFITGGAGTADRIQAYTRSAVPGQQAALVTFTANQYDNTWVQVVATYSGDANRVINVANGSYINTKTASHVTGNLDEICLGNGNAGSNYADGLIADCAIYNKVLTSGEINELSTKTADQVAAANLRAYYPLDTDRDTEGTILNEGLDATGDLTISGATYNISHPTLSAGGAGGVTLTDSISVTDGDPIQ